MQELVENIDELANELEKAISIATTPPYGPVLIDIPLDIQKEELNKSYKSDVEIRVTDDFDYQIENVLVEIQRSNKPIIVAGGGIRQGNAYEELSRLVDYTGIPVVRTLAGLEKNQRLYFAECSLSLESFFFQYFSFNELIYISIYGLYTTFVE
ncbi:Thiamine pyrophosphate enzyme, N-terminal TPP binding domain [Butyrivibrio proteoclasticus]|uniref:Thiamine pyrophosphate enzyme, N-terminal TPP binding domain n=1 Tax=Butyrivibrio proteoclasticus TaxID=43305 RepID=A0A1I5Y013_9FIRM|nr:thiamine pyrophosphate-binding protein [Butyrivibrio proteoclasticus]SFQ37533.1 Thiamine pyrophosphate enzyme, N-terminal TPP binding domain [Butyrivibrio proteoclasticus]